MNNFRKLITDLSTNEQENAEAEKIMKFLCKADCITKDSSSKEICDLVAEIVDYQSKNISFFNDILCLLVHLLSACISAKCNMGEKEFVQLKNFIASKKELLKGLKFV